jgi:hypothetical protein
MPKLLRYRRLYDVLTESETDFKSRITGMPVYLLLSEHRLISEQYGVESFKANDHLTDRISLIYDRLSFVNKEIDIKNYFDLFSNLFRSSMFQFCL